MANHKSAKKRSIQSKLKNIVNTQYLTKIRTNLNKYSKSLKSDNQEDIQKSLNEVLGNLYPLDSELADYDKKDRQLQTAISVLQSIDETGKNKDPLTIFKDEKESILNSAKKFIDMPKEESSTE